VKNKIIIYFDGVSEYGGGSKCWGYVAVGVMLQQTLTHFV
jgi:hypothetical protein